MQELVFDGDITTSLTQYDYNTLINSGDVLLIHGYLSNSNFVIRAQVTFIVGIFSNAYIPISASTKLVSFQHDSSSKFSVYSQDTAQVAKIKIYRLRKV